MRIKNERKDVFKRGQSIIGKMRKLTRKYESRFDQLFEAEGVSPEAKEAIKETIELMNELCSFGDSYLALERQRTMQLNRMESNIETIKGLLEARA